MQGLLFPVDDRSSVIEQQRFSTFADNMKLPVHRWIRYSAGFSAAWVESVINEHLVRGTCNVLDPFVGSGTTILAAEDMGCASCGIESHPFVARLAAAKLARRSDPDAYLCEVNRVLKSAKSRTPVIDSYPTLIRKCYGDIKLQDLDVLRQAVMHCADDAPSSQLVWLTLIGILRKVADVNTAQWQYVLPRKPKKSPQQAFSAFKDMSDIVYEDMVASQSVVGPTAQLLATDARSCDGVPDKSVNLVITSPPYPNNYDYADATRLEMSFLGEVSGWGDLQQAVRKFLLRSCSQHVPVKSVELSSVLESTELKPIRDEITTVCNELARIRLTKGGRKTYHLMIACYFFDLSRVWKSLRRVCASPCRVCFVIGDSAPYGVYVPVIEWLGALALAAGFSSYSFERTRDRNVKWKNRKHRVPLCEGRLWVEG